MPAHKVRDVISRLEDDGYEEVRGRGKGSHRMFTKEGCLPITIPGKLSDDLRPGTYNNIARSANWQ